MGIDGIKGPGPSVPTGVPGAEGTGFKEALTPGSSEARGAAAPSDALAKLQAGQIGVDEYLDLQVQQAVTHLQGTLSVEELDFVQRSLREQLSQDPVLLELVRQTTGSTPSE
jgi:hypothetical protein